VKSINVEAMVQYALTFEGKPYVYGGNGTPAVCYKWTEGSSCSVHTKGTKYTGYDCSGYVYAVLSKYGIDIPRTTSQMNKWSPGEYGSVLGASSAIKRGDIILYSGHVGIAISSTQMIDAPKCGKNISRRTIYSGITRIIRFNDSGNATTTTTTTTTSSSSVKSENILSGPTANATQMRNWATNKKATQTFIDNADYFYSYGQKMGVNPVLAYAQYAWETGYGQYKGQVKESQKNTCGIKTSDNTGFASFSTWNLGIEAHIDHLGLYAGGTKYPRSSSPDPKHFQSLYGKYTTIDAMGNAWSGGSSTYATNLKRLMAEIESSAGASSTTNNTTTVATAPSLTGKKVYLDPGHGGTDSGSIGNGLYEKNINLNVAQMIKELLEERGATVQISRSTDVYVSLADRATKANNFGADCFISIHCNSADVNTAQGVETYYYASASTLAEAIQNQILANKNLYNKNRGVKKDNFYVIRETKMMSALVELAFINNASDANILKNYQYGFAEAIAKGIVQYLGCSWTTVATTTDTVQYVGQVYNYQNLPLRANYDPYATVLEYLPEGELVDVYEVIAYGIGWVKLKSKKGNVGYANANYIKKYGEVGDSKSYIYQVYSCRSTSKMEAEDYLSKIKALGFTNATLDTRTQ
jgi:N-acetylmuramoyl-L-alanine amidase